MNQHYTSDVEAIKDLVNSYQKLRTEIGKVIVGQDAVVRDVLISIFSKGHCLLVGVPGLAKTLLVNTISQALGLSFNRIQFTPDLMPSDITGIEILDENRHFKFIKGPVFANIILADEINRTPPKTQAALLEAMQERSVTVSGKGMICLFRFLFWQHKTQSNKKVLIPFLKHSLTDLCLTFFLTILRLKKKFR